MNKALVVSGILLAFAGLTGLIYGAGINLQGMMARGATDYSFVTAYIIEWSLVLLAGLVLTAAGFRKK